MTYEYALPSPTSPGRPYWYTLRLQGTATFPGTAAGQYLLTARVDEYASAQLQFSVTADAIETSSVGLVTGQQRVTAAGRSAAFNYENYVRDAALAPGPQRLVLELTRQDQQEGGEARVELGPSSALNATKMDYRELGLGVPTRPITVTVGREVKLPFAVQRRGGRPDGPTEVVLRTTDDGVRVVGASSLHFDEVGGRAAGSFVLRGGSPGHYRAQVSVPGRYNQPAQIVAVDVVEGGAAAGHEAVRVGVAATCLAVGTLILSPTFLRRSRLRRLARRPATRRR